VDDVVEKIEAMEDEVSLGSASDTAACGVPQRSKATFLPRVWFVRYNRWTSHPSTSSKSTILIGSSGDVGLRR
jgi:hypothetical protein